MVRKRVEIEYPDDAELGRSRQDTEASSPNFFVPDAKGVKGQVKIYEIDEDESDLPDDYLDYPPSAHKVSRRVAERDPFADALSDALAQVMTHYINLGVAKATPHVKRWVLESAVPAVKATAQSARIRVTQRGRARRAEAQEAAAVVDAASTETLPELDAALDDRPLMSSEEAQSRIAAALLAKAFSDEQMRMVFGARIEDGDAFEAWIKSMEGLTPSEIEAHIHSRLASNPSFLEEFFTTLLGGRPVEVQRVPVTNREVDRGLLGPTGEGAERANAGD